MMKVLSSRLFWGLALVFGGALLLLDTLSVINVGDIFWTIVTALAGILFLSLFVTNHDHWWALIPGIILLTISVTIGLYSFLPGFSKTNLSVAILFGGISLSFLLVYIAARSNWWAIIPAGIIATIAATAIVDKNNSDFRGVGLFFFGLGITFALVAILPTSAGRMWWAWIPAGILGLIGSLILIEAEKYINYIWPSLLILGGILLVGRSLRR
jgi:hypothetical protein